MKHDTPLTDDDRTPLVVLSPHDDRTPMEVSLREVMLVDPTRPIPLRRRRASRPPRRLGPALLVAALLVIGVVSFLVTVALERGGR